MRVLDLFSGACGGWSLGLHRAGFTTVAACEINDWRREQFGRNFPHAKLYSDVRQLTRERLDGDGCGPIDVICGSPPCKEYSSANHRGQGLDADDLFLEAVRLVAEVRPAWAAFENSPRVRTQGYDRIALALEALGYASWPLVVGIANAGAAHRRARAWIICFDTDRDGEHGIPVDGEVAGSLGSVSSDVYGLGQVSDGGGRGRPGADGCGGRIPADRHCAGLRIEQGRRCGPDGQDAPISFEPSAILGPVPSRPLGEHLRKYDGLPAGVAERCRSAYGDAVSPIIPELIGRAIMAAEHST